MKFDERYIDEYIAQHERHIQILEKLRKDVNDWGPFDGIESSFGDGKIKVNLIILPQEMHGCSFPGYNLDFIDVTNDFVCFHIAGNFSFSEKRWFSVTNIDMAKETDNWSKTLEFRKILSTCVKAQYRLPETQKLFIKYVNDLGNLLATFNLHKHVYVKDEEEAGIRELSKVFANKVKIILESNKSLRTRKKKS